MGIKFTTLIIGFLHLTSLASADLTLSQIQPITGFTPACTTAYDYTVYGCNITNFFPPVHGPAAPVLNDSCTSNCRSSLLTVQGYIRAGCYFDGVQFGNKSLIGQFMLDAAVDWLCGLKSGIAMTDLPLQAAAAPPVFQSVGVSSPAVTVTLSSGLPPAKLSETASTTTLVASPASPFSTSSSAAPPPPAPASSASHSVNSSNFSGSHTLTNSDGTPTAVPSPLTTDGIAWPSRISGEPAGPISPASTMCSIKNTASTPAPSATPTMVAPATSLMIMSTVLHSTAPLTVGNSTTSSTQVITTQDASATKTETATASASSSNAAEVGKSSFALVLGVGAMIGFAT